MYVLKHINAPTGFPARVIEQCYSEGEIVVIDGVCVVREEASKAYLHGVGYDCFGEIVSLEQLPIFLDGSLKAEKAEAKQVKVEDLVLIESPGGGAPIKPELGIRGGVDDLAAGNSEPDYWWRNK